ncbi:MAG: PhoH family protein [Mycoplasmataceae bacterium]|nr:PhoH family protein [Mycoplasmataceae bacterium]
MGKDKNRNDKLARTLNNQRAMNDYDAEKGKHTARAIGHREFPKLKPRNEEQNTLIKAIYNGGDLIVGGRAGTGKTFTSSVCALDMVLNDSYTYKKLVLIRPNQPLGPSVGMLKGDLIEKIWPWICPFVDAFDYRINRKELTNMIEVGQMELVLVEHLQGRTFKDSIILVDEFQNMTEQAAKSLVGRKGEGSKLIIMHDLVQCILKPNELSGVEYIERIEYLAEKFGHRLPYRTIDLIQNERSSESAWWTGMEDLYINYDFENDTFINEE